MTRTHWLVPMLAISLLAACREGPDFDGLYRVESYTRNETSCTGPGPEIERPYSQFKIEERDFFGVTIYPAYPCDEDGACDADNDSNWSLVVLEDDLDQVSFTYALSEGNSCILASQDLVIAGVEGSLVLQNRSTQLVLEPYDANTCNPENAEAKRDKMECVTLLELVGSPEPEPM